MLKIGVLASGSGSNFQSIIDNIENGNINAKIEVLITNKKTAYSLERAKKHNIEGIYINAKEYDGIEGFNDKIIEILKEKEIDLVILAGYLKILSNKFISEFKNKIINIHPSLIPSFCGDGFYGMNVHNAVYEKAVKISGATVHFVDEGVDTGAIIMQKSVELNSEDKPEDIAKKVLKIEHEILPKVVKLFSEDKIILENNRVIVK